MSSISSVFGNTAGAAWDVVKQTVKGAGNGDVADIAKVVIGAAVASGSIPASTGVAALAGGMVAGSLIDVFV